MPNREGPPRIGPISDFSGVVVPPSQDACNGLITFPVTDQHYIRSEGFTSSNSSPTPQGMQGTTWWGATIDVKGISGASAIVADTDGMAGPNPYEFTAYATGYYSMKANLGSTIVSNAAVIWTWQVRFKKNGVVFAQYEFIFTTGPSPKGFFIFIPFVQMDINDTIAFDSRILSNNPAHSAAGPFVNPTNAVDTQLYFEVTYLGS